MILERGDQIKCKRTTEILTVGDFKKYSDSTTIVCHNSRGEYRGIQLHNVYLGSSLYEIIKLEKDSRVESLFYSEKLDRFQIVGVNKKGKFYRASSIGEWDVYNEIDAAHNLGMNDYKLVGRL